MPSVGSQHVPHSGAFVYGALECLVNKVYPKGSDLPVSPRSGMRNSVSVSFEVKVFFPFFSFLKIFIYLLALLGYACGIFDLSCMRAYAGEDS